MPNKKFTREKAFQFCWKGIKGWSYTSSKDLSNGSVAVIEVNGNHGKVMSKISNRIYYIIEGNGIFIVDGKKLDVKKDDVVIVEKNTPYDYEGKMKLFLVHIPAWDEAQEVILEKKKGRN